MEANTLLGLVIGTIGVAYLAHGFLGKVVSGERHSISLIAGSSVLAALAIMLSSNIAPPVALAFGVLYGVIVESLWRSVYFDTSSTRGFIKNLVCGYLFGTSIFTLGFIFSDWDEHKITGFASEMRSDFISAAGFVAFLTVLFVVAYLLKRLMHRMSRPLLRVVGAALVLVGIACIMAPSVLPLFRIKVA